MLRIDKVLSMACSQAPNVLEMVTAFVHTQIMSGTQSALRALQSKDLFTSQSSNAAFH